MSEIQRDWIGYEITDDPVENTRRWYDAVARAEYGDVITVVPGEYAVRVQAALEAGVDNTTEGVSPEATK